MGSDVVVPGEKIADKPIKSFYTYVENGKTYSTVVGLFRNGRIIPLNGPYFPEKDDLVVGVISEVKIHGYGVYLATPYDAFIPARDVVRSRFDVGDIIVANVSNVDEVKNITLTNVRKLGLGRLIEVPPVKVPRIIGRNNSMINMIKEKTGCVIIVGRNGLIWISPKGKVSLAVDAIRKVVKEAHIPGLTDRMARFMSHEPEL
ncbi:RNA-binding protein [Candidatus Micrarchaeota archaeon]|nr:RNA-binding protein [Candidatus Micrarchaeota archaeon]